MNKKFIIILKTGKLLLEAALLMKIHGKNHLLENLNHLLTLIQIMKN